MRTRTLLIALALALGFIGGAVWAQRAVMPAAYADGGNGTVVTPLGPDAKAPAASPVVACTPYAYTTENELDPFDSTRIRRTRTSVSSVVLVHADGTTEVQKVKDKD
jgi:hypothetical protein